MRLLAKQASGACLRLSAIGDVDISLEFYMLQINSELTIGKILLIAIREG